MKNQVLAQLSHKNQTSEGVYFVVTGLENKAYWSSVHAYKVQWSNVKCILFHTTRPNGVLVWPKKCTSPPDDILLKKTLFELRNQLKCYWNLLKPFGIYFI